MRLSFRNKCLFLLFLGNFLELRKRLRNIFYFKIKIWKGLFSQCLSCNDKTSFSYTIIGGDTLASISNGDKKLIEDIIHLNPAVFNDDGIVLPEGKVICMPFDAGHKLVEKRFNHRYMDDDMFYVFRPYPYSFKNFYKRSVKIEKKWNVNLKSWKRLKNLF